MGPAGLTWGRTQGPPSSNITGEKEVKKACRPADVMDGGTARHGQTVLFKRQPHVVSSSTFVPSGSPPAFFRQAAAPEGGGLSFETGCSKARARADCPRLRRCPFLICLCFWSRNTSMIFHDTTLVVGARSKAQQSESVCIRAGKGGRYPAGRLIDEICPPSRRARAEEALGDASWVDLRRPSSSLV